MIEKTPSSQFLLYGSDDPLPEKRVVRAGPLRAEYEQADLRAVRLGDREILRRVYFAVRDAGWETVEPRISNTRLDVEEDSFAIRFDARHREGPIDFAWEGAIRGDPDGTIRFEARGTAGSTFPSNRIGFCVLHPIRECAGRACTVERPDGSTVEGVFPELISPEQPFTDIAAITHEIDGGVRAEVRFRGDIFEMEDQRNWTDESFKTYSRPLHLPFPVEVREGARIEQSVTLRILGAPAPAETAEAAPAHAEPGEIAPAIELAGAPSGPIPAIGLDATHAVLGPDALRRLRDLRLAHLRVDLALSDSRWRDVLRRARDEAEAIGAGLEAAVFISDAAGEELRALREAADALRLYPPIRRWLIFHASEPSTGLQWVDLARRHLASYDPGARIGGGTDGFFAELNRARPPAGAFDVACFAASPQVHANDNTTVVEGLQGQAWTIRSARAFLGGVPLAVSPITLLPRSRFPGRDPYASPPADPRQVSLFAAAWTVGSLGQVCEAGAGSVTYYETAGPRGVMAADGTVFPVYHVFSAMGAFAGGRVIPARSSRPLLVEGVAVRRGGRTRVLVANLSADPRRVTIAGLRGLPRVRCLDETNALAAIESPEGFWRGPGEAAEAPDGSLEIPLRPCAIACIDLEEE